MHVTKKVIGELEKCYSLAPLEYKGKGHMLVAAEKINQCRLYDLNGTLEEVIWEEPGGTMSMVQVPGTDGQFLATHQFYSPNDSKEAKIILASPSKEGWKIQTIAELPFVHRFDIISRNGIHYVIACTLKSGHEYKEDWRSPGKIYVGKLPQNLTEIDDQHPLKMKAIKDGLLKNHGYCKAVVDGVERAFVASDEGVFCVTPLEKEDGQWEIQKVLDEASSDMALADFDQDGELEILTISPFHGEKVSIFKKQNGQWKKIYTYEKDVEFAHAIWGGEIAGETGVIIGHRKGERDLLFFHCTDNEKLTFEAQLLDHNVGPANVLCYTYEGAAYILSANREIDEIALYKVER